MAGSIKEVYTCGDCGKTEEFNPGSTDSYNLIKGGWLVIEAIGGNGGVYCPDCRHKHDLEAISEKIPTSMRELLNKQLDESLKQQIINCDL